MVVSFRISRSLTPPGLCTRTSSPTSLFNSARPIGEVVEIFPFAAVAVSLVDTVVAATVLVAMMVYYGIAPSGAMCAGR